MTPTLPPGQIVTKRFPVVGERTPSAVVTSWEIRFEGLVAEPKTLSLEELITLGQRDVTFDIHCVTSWTRFESTFTGVPLSELLEPLEPGRFVSFTANSAHDHHTSLPLDVALQHCWIVHTFEGEPLSTEHGGPLRVVTPGRYFYKSLKWLRTVEVLEEDRLGWWETNSAYHNNADPSRGDERFTSGSLRPEQLSRFLEAPNYDKYRRRVMIGLDLKEWKPATRDLRGLHLKNCDMTGVDLAGVDLRESNLSLSRLVGSNLTGADLSGSDLEGADFTGADLSGANLGHCALSAARFDEADVAGATFDGAWGLLEGQQALLADRGVNFEEPK